MELRKRSLNVQGRHPSVKKQRRPRSELEDLPGEIWFELFAYFDGHSLLHSFSDLNQSIQSILTDIRLPIHLNLSSFDSLPSSFHLTQILSLTINYSQMKSLDHLHLESFVRLRSLRLLHINDEQLEELSRLPLDNLVQLTIRSKCAKHLTKILSNYFPSVRRVTLQSLGREFLVRSFAELDQRSQVEKLTLDGKIKMAKLFRLWPFIPQIRSLALLNGGVHQCDYWIDEDLLRLNTFPPHLCSLHLTICDDDLSFSNLERLIPADLRHLRVSGSMADDDLDEYLSPANWIRLMSRCSTQLRGVQLDLSSYFDPSDASGLQKTLNKFRRTAFFRDVAIQSKNFLVTLQGSIRPSPKI